MYNYAENLDVVSLNTHLCCSVTIAVHITSHRVGEISHYHKANPEPQGLIVCSLQHNKIFKTIEANLSDPHLVELLGQNKCLRLYRTLC